uniref:MULE transposase domain-containing protein n=1 Tax=Arundo donax TaxID=35708 RepID=A0A0A8YT92_ARUDO
MVRSIFWTDARSQLDYSLFGDFISFDTTYSTNKYNMPFAPLIGINGHSRNIVFGWALL